MVAPTTWQYRRLSPSWILTFFLSDLQTEQSYVDGEIFQLVTDLVSKPKRIKTQQTAARVLRISENSTNDNIQKLKAIASCYNCSLICSSWFILAILSAIFCSLSFTFWQKYLSTHNTHSFCTQISITQVSVHTIVLHTIVVFPIAWYTKAVDIR